MEANDIIAAGRYQVWKRHPFMAAVLLSLRPTPKPGIGTLAVDAGWRLYYDPEFVVKCGVGCAEHDGIAPVLFHETWHCLVDSHGRRGDRHPMLWNFAEDRAINDGAIDAGWKFPEEPLLPKQIGKPDGLTGEEYYEVEKEKTISALAKMMTPGSGHQCGGCAGNPHEWEKAEGKTSSGSGQEADSSSPPPVEQAAQTLLRRQVAQDIIEATARGQGNVPAGLREWADKVLEPPRVNWQKQLAGLVRGAIASRAGAADYTWRRLSKRQWGLGTKAILPSLHQPVPKVVGILDVSGSMAGSPADLARAEIVGVCRALGSPVDFVSCDTRIVSRAKVRGRQDIAKLGDTQGGTSLDVAIRELDRERPDVIVVLTDGQTGWTAAGETRARIIAAITPGGSVPPEYIAHVMIEDK